MLFFPRPWIFSSFAWINWHSAQYLEGTLYITPKFSLRFSLFSVLCLIYSSYLCIPNKGFHWAMSRFPSLCHDSLKIESKEELTLFIFLISEITVFQCLTSIVLKCVVYIYFRFLIFYYLFFIVFDGKLNLVPVIPCWQETEVISVSFKYSFTFSMSLPVYFIFLLYFSNLSPNFKFFQLCFS